MFEKIKNLFEYQPEGGEKNMRDSAVETDPFVRELERMGAEEVPLSEEEIQRLEEDAEKQKNITEAFQRYDNVGKRSEEQRKMLQKEIEDRKNGKKL